MLFKHEFQNNFFSPSRILTPVDLSIEICSYYNRKPFHFHFFKNIRQVTWPIVFVDVCLSTIICQWYKLTRWKKTL